MTDVSERIEAFRSSISTNLLARDDFIDWDIIEAEVAKARDSLAQLQTYVQRGEFNADTLAGELRAHPKIYEIIQSLIAFKSSGAQVDKWGLPPTVPQNSSRAHWLAMQLIYIGIERLLFDTPLEPMLRVAEVYKDSFRRRFRSGKTLEQRIKSLVRQAVGLANSQVEQTVRLDSSGLTDPLLRRSVEYVVAADSRPVAGIATVFQNQSGGRQQRDLAQTYPLLQEKIATHGMDLILIADGQGLGEASERTLTALFGAVRHPMTIVQAQDGMLKESIVAACAVQAPVTLGQAALNRLINGMLEARLMIKAEELPIPPGPAALALARFAEARAELGLTLSPGGEKLEWKNAEAVADAQALAGTFAPSQALDLFASLVEASEQELFEQGDEVRAVLRIADTPPFTGRLHVTATTHTVAADLTRDIGIRSMEEAPGSSVAILLTPFELGDQELETHRKKQTARPVNVVLISPTMLLMMAQRVSPLTTLIDAILAQSDLTKVSPFILSNPTPMRMFYGRETEAATVLSTIATNSVAILGSRRIGKTSLIRRVQEELETSNFQPFFGDCQTVKTWKDFAGLARQGWNVDAPEEFEPHHLSDLVSQLTRTADGQVVLLLDEIDQLLEWDRRHTEDSVPEAFFRACRSISQTGAAQFVFSGERTIANRVWDPQSPHWNFCRPVALSQLSSEAATLLLIQPLRGMNITITDEGAFGAEAWSFTSGHPQIVQFLGDRLVRLLDDRSDRTQLSLSVDEIRQVTGTYEFAEHYISTYWGQATRLEKLISLLVAQMPANVADLGTALSAHGLDNDSDELMSALRMLQLYGVLEEDDHRFVLRAKWFAAALEHFGGVEAELDRLMREKEG